MKISVVEHMQQKRSKNIQAAKELIIKRKNLFYIRSGNHRLKRDFSEFEASKNAVRSLKFDASRSKFDASQRALS